MKKRFAIILLFSSLTFLAGLTASWRIVTSQNAQKRLIWTYITTQLIDKTLPIETKNTLLINKVSQNGVDFDLTPDEEQTLLALGANPDLINAIKERGPKSNPVQVPSPKATETPAPATIETGAPIGTSTPAPTETPKPVIRKGDPISKKEILLFKLNDDSQMNGEKGLLKVIENYGVDFQLTDAIENELRRKGAKQNLIDAIRNNYVPPKGPPPASFKNVIGMQFVNIPAGSFRMGSEFKKRAVKLGSEEDNAYDNGRTMEQPAHTVTFKNGFIMGKFEVTQEQWERVMKLSIYDQRNLTKTNGKYDYRNDPEGDLFGVGPNYPIYWVSWEDAMDFIGKLNAMDPEYEYDLPTEAQWEYACRAGTKGDYGGSGILDEMGWYLSNSGIDPTRNADEEWEKAGNNGDRFKQDFLVPNKNMAHEVGQKKPNAFGLYDMHGNVFEWAKDIFKDNYGGAEPDGSANFDTSFSRDRVLRGGAWTDNFPAAELSRSAARSYHSSPARTNRSKTVGFRIVARRK